MIALVVAGLTWVLLTRTLKGFEVTVTGASPQAARFAGFDARRTTLFAFLFSGAMAGLAGIIEVSGAIGRLTPVVSPGYGFTAIIVAFLGRLNPLGIVLAGFLLALSYLGGEAAQVSLGLSDRVARVFQGVLLFAVLTADTLTRYEVRLARPAAARGTRHPPCRRPPRRYRRLPMLEAILITVTTAATPLLIAALGELVAERAGVLNLGVEGMMAAGAVAAFGAASASGSPWLGLVAAAVVGVAMALMFALASVVLATNQVATGLALTLFGLGASGLAGEAFVGRPGLRLPRLDVGLSDVPFVGARCSSRRTRCSTCRWC